MAKTRTALDFVYSPKTKGFYLGFKESEVKGEDKIAGTISFKSSRDQLGFILELKDALDIKLSKAVDVNSLLGLHGEPAPVRRAGKKAAATRRQPRRRRRRRTSAEMAAERKLGEIRMKAKKKLKLPLRGRLKPQDQARLDAEIEKMKPSA